MSAHLPDPHEHVVVDAFMMRNKGEPRSAMRWTYIVEWVGTDGGREWAWLGYSYADAMIAAANFGLQIINNISGGAYERRGPC